MKTLCVVLCFAATACAPAPEDQPRRNATPSVSVVTARVSQFTKTVAATGRFGASTGGQTRLAFSEPGILSAVHVQLGDHVAEGAALAELDATQLALGADQAAAELRVAAAAQGQAQVDRTTTKIRIDGETLRRARSLYAAGVAPRKDIDAAVAQLADDRAQAAVAQAGVTASVAEVASAQARAALARRAVAQTTLRAPVSGIVMAVLHRVGEAVDPSTPVVAIAPANPNALTLLVASSDLSRVRAGDVVRYAVAGSAVHGIGKVDGVAPALDAQSQSGNVTARVDGAGVPAGSMVESEIEVEHLRGIVLPEEAVVVDPQTGRMFVFVERSARNGPARFEQREVRVRDTGNEGALVAGVRAGERIAAEGAFALLAPADGG